MSLDTVDDLHAAEDWIGTLQLRIERTVTEWRAWMEEMGPGFSTTLPGPFVDSLQQLERTTRQPFERPSCEEDEDTHECIQGEDCGGYHSWMSEEATSPST